MEFFKRKTQIDFIRHRRIAYCFSATVMVASIAVLVLRGLNFGIDFTGGTLLEVSYPRQIETESVRTELARAGFPQAVVQYFGGPKDVLVRIPPVTGADKSALGDRVMQVLRTNADGAPELRRVEFVGPQVGEELVTAGGLAVLIALGAILVYIWLRFERRLAIGAVAATIHDPIIIVGFFAVTRMDFDLTVLAAILAVIGYSVNDTIVVFDRIRENFRRHRGLTPAMVINTSVNETLSRTIITSGTTLLVVIALLLVGGSLLHGFSTALFLGIIVGTYSSIYVASATALDLGLNRKDLMPLPKETGQSDKPNP